MNKSFNLQLSQAESGAVVLSESDHSTVLSLRQLLQLRFRSVDLHGFDTQKMKQFYAGLGDPLDRQEVHWGFHPNDQVVKQYLDQVVIINSECVQIVGPESGTRFIVDLDDSKRSGRRVSLNMPVERQLEIADVYISSQFARIIGVLTDPETK